MTEYFNVVPWFNNHEWHKVYDLIYSPTSTEDDKRAALDTLAIWKARCPSLPAGVESTLTLLQVRAQDAEWSARGADASLRLAYSAAVTRFVNHALDADLARGAGLYVAARRRLLPAWLVDVRHDAAHRAALPALPPLRGAARASLRWLQDHYWERHRLCVGDLLANDARADSDARIAALLHFCVSLGVCAHPECKIKNLAEIPDAAMRESIVNDARDLLGDRLDMSNLKTVAVSQLINAMNVQAKKLLRNKERAAHVNGVLLGEDSLLLSLELLELLGGREFRARRLSAHYVQVFRPLLELLQVTGLLSRLVLDLAQLSRRRDQPRRSLLAALWLATILQALNKSQEFHSKVKSGVGRRRREVLASFLHWQPGARADPLLPLSLRPPPAALTRLGGEGVGGVLSAASPLLALYVRPLVSLVRPRVPAAAADRLYRLAGLLAGDDLDPLPLPPAGAPMEPARIYTVDDLKKAAEAASDSDCEMIEDSDSAPAPPPPLPPPPAVWPRAALPAAQWARCPVGTLPWLITSDS